MNYLHTEITQTLTKHYREDLPAKSMQGTKFSKLTAEWKTCSQLINKPKQDLFMQLKELLTTNDILPGDLSRYIKIKFSPFYCRCRLKYGWFSQNGSHIYELQYHFFPISITLPSNVILGILTNG